MWTDNLRQFHFWCQKTLPLVYDDSLSYYEVLAKVTRHLNELTTLVNEIGDELERYEGVTDERLDALETWKSTIDTWKTEIDSWKAIVDTWRENVDGWKESIDLWKTSIENWQTSINSWKDIVDNTFEMIDERLDIAESDINNIETVLNSEYTYLGTVHYNSDDDRVYITLNTGTSCDKLQGLVDFEGKHDISRLNHKPVFYITFDSDVISHFENEQYPVDSRIYFQDLNADVFSYMKQGSYDIILDGLAIVMSDYNTLKTVKSGVTYRAFYIGNGLYYSFENVGTDIENRLIGVEDGITSLEGRVDDAEDDVTDLQNRMSTAETNLIDLDKALRIISISVGYDQTAQIFKAFCTTLGDDNFIKNNLTAAKIPGSAFGVKVRFLMRLSDSTPYDYSNIYLYDDYGNAIQYEGSDAYLTISHSDDGVFLNGIDATHLYLLDTHWQNALAYSMPGTNSGQLPRPTNPSTDNGKVVAYNETLKNYELITPPSPSVLHTYSTTEQVVGTWVDNNPVYEKTVPVTINSGTNSSEIILGFGITNLISFDLIVGYSDSGFRRSYNNTLQATGNYATNGMCWVGACRLKNQNSISVMLGATTDRVYTGYAVLRYTR